MPETYARAFASAEERRIAAAGRGELAPINSHAPREPAPVQKSRSEPVSNGSDLPAFDPYTPKDEFDPLARLYRQQRELDAAGARGEVIGTAMDNVKRSIASIIEGRAARHAAQEKGRSRGSREREL